MPEILPENSDAWRVFQHVNDQHIMAFGGPVAINMIPVFKVMEKLCIKNQLECMAKIKTTYTAFIGKLKK